jgi:hypothetical protein
MLTVSTQLYINGLPVDYAIVANGEKFLFEPFFNPHDVEAPRFEMIKKDGDLKAIHSIDAYIIEQAVEDLNRLFNNS